MEQSVNAGHRKAPQTHKVSRDEFSKATWPDTRSQDFGDGATDCKGQSLPAAFSVVLSRVHMGQSWLPWAGI